MKNHYEVLNLEKNCSAKEIKDSFIKLSKKYHPDKNKTSEAHRKFIEVNEAYSVLGKTLSRSRYDDSLLNSQTHTRGVYQSASPSSYNHYEYYQKVYTHTNKYESKNLRGASKHQALLFCCLLMAIGTGIRFMVLWNEANNRESRNKQISATLTQVRERAQRLGKEQAINEMRKTLMNEDAKVDSSKNQ